LKDEERGILPCAANRLPFFTINQLLAGQKAVFCPAICTKIGIFDPFILQTRVILLLSKAFVICGDLLFAY
jgi:hypothetical protein